MGDQFKVNLNRKSLNRYGIRHIIRSSRVLKRKTRFHNITNYTRDLSFYSYIIQMWQFYSSILSVTFWRVLYLSTINTLGEEWMKARKKICCSLQCCFDVHSAYRTRTLPSFDFCVSATRKIPRVCLLCVIISSIVYILSLFVLKRESSLSGKRRNIFIYYLQFF